MGKTFFNLKHVMILNELGNDLLFKNKNCDSQLLLTEFLKRKKIKYKHGTQNVRWILKRLNLN